MYANNDAQRKAEASKMERLYSLKRVLVGLLSTGLFGYFALGYDGDPKHCLASLTADSQAVSSKVSVTVQTENAVDIGAMFGQVFTVVFYASVVDLVCGVVYWSTSNKLTKNIAHTVSLVATWAALLAIFVGIILRHSNAGAVCSGDFLLQNESTSGYLIVKGQALSVLTIVWVTLMSIGLCVGLVAFFLLYS